MASGTYHDGYLAGTRDTTEVMSKLNEKLTSELLEAQRLALRNWVGFQPCAYLNQLADEKPEYIGTWYTIGKILRDRQLSGIYELQLHEFLNGIEEQHVIKAVDYLKANDQVEIYWTAHLPNEEHPESPGIRLPGTWEKQSDIPNLVLDADGNKHSIYGINIFKWHKFKWITLEESLSPAA